MSERSTERRRPCGCGCGEPVNTPRSEFLPDHSAQLFRLIIEEVDGLANLRPIVEAHLGRPLRRDLLD